jgi:hypothetical protein
VGNTDQYTYDAFGDFTVNYLRFTNALVFGNSYVHLKGTVATDLVYLNIMNVYLRSEQ